MYKMKKHIIKIITAVSVLFFAAAVTGHDIKAADTVSEPAMVYVDPVDLFLSQSAFVGNSVGEGLTLYNNAMKKAPLGNATMLTKVSYSFYNDEARNKKFLPVFNGVPMRAKDAIKACGASYVFICMGTNDLVGATPVDSAVARYQKYIVDILTENPTVTIFIESCTPTRPGSNVNNDKITLFNAAMLSYCSAFPNLYYIDISTPLMDAQGYLSSALTSDGSVHLTNKAYAIWAATIRQYVAGFLTARLTSMVEETNKRAEQNRAANEQNLRLVAQKQQNAHEDRIKAQRVAEAAEKIRKRDELLNVPDDITIMRTLADAGKESASCVPYISSSVVSSFISSL